MHGIGIIAVFEQEVIRTDPVKAFERGQCLVDELVHGGRGRRRRYAGNCPTSGAPGSCAFLEELFDPLERAPRSRHDARTDKGRRIRRQTVIFWEPMPGEVTLRLDEEVAAVLGDRGWTVSTGFSVVSHQPVLTPGQDGEEQQVTGERPEGERPLDDRPVLLDRFKERFAALRLPDRLEQHVRRSVPAIGEPFQFVEKKAVPRQRQVKQTPAHRDAFSQSNRSGMKPESIRLLPNTAIRIDACLG